MLGGREPFVNMLISFEIVVSSYHMVTSVSLTLYFIFLYKIFILSSYHMVTSLSLTLHFIFLYKIFIRSINFILRNISKLTNSFLTFFYFEK